MTTYFQRQFHLWTSVGWIKILSLKIHNFDVKDSGCNATLQNLSTPLDYFQLFFPKFLVNFIVEETNNYQNFLKI
jgi:hypothetical protein